MNKKMIAALAVLATMTACHGKTASKDDKTAQAVPEKGMPLSDFQGMAKQHGGKPEVMRMMTVAGRWESQPGAVAKIGTRHITLTISNDNKFTLDLMGRDPKATIDTVDIDVRGDITWTKEGMLKGTGKGAKAPLKSFDTWQASFPSTGKMTIKGSDGTTYGLSYMGA